MIHGDIRMASDFEALPAVDWVIDAAANPSVLAGIQGGFSSRQLIEHNLAGVVNVLEYCKGHRAGLLLTEHQPRLFHSGAGVASAAERTRTLFLDENASLPPGVSARGIGVDFSTRAPISLYGSTKLASETLALEYGDAFDFPVWINRCGVLAGAGQFGTPDQGMFSYWIHAHARRRPLRFIGFDGTGKQTRDVFHPRDLTALADAQMNLPAFRRTAHLLRRGRRSNSMSLAQLTAWCDAALRCACAQRGYAAATLRHSLGGHGFSDAERDFGWQIEISAGT